MTNSLWQYHSESRFSRFRLNQQLSMMPVHNDIMRNMQTEARPFSGWLRGKERFKDSQANLLGNSWPIIYDFDNHMLLFGISSQADFTFAVHGIDRVIDDVCPDLV